MSRHLVSSAATWARIAAVDANGKEVEPKPGELDAWRKRQ